MKKRNSSRVKNFDVYGPNTISVRTVLQKWCKRLQSGNFDVNGASSSDRLRISVTTFLKKGSKIDI